MPHRLFHSHALSTLSFATSGPNARSTQLFFNFGDNSGLDKQGFSPIGRVIKGMEIIDKVYAGYNDSEARPNQSSIKQFGNAYVSKNFPKLSYIASASVVGSKQQ